MSIERNNMSGEIFSSTGELGASRRQDNRLYVNAREACSDPEALGDVFQRMLDIQGRHPEQVGRVVYRGVVSDNVLSYLVSDPGLNSNLEVALPLREFSGDNSWLIYLANNRSGRDRIVGQEVMIWDSFDQKDDVTPPVDRVGAIRSHSEYAGLGSFNTPYRFLTEIPEEAVDEVHELWGSTFGWQRDQALSLSGRLNTQASDRDVWFSAISHRGKIVSLAMAEMRPIPSFNGALNLVESTEWRTKNGFEGKGLMTATVTALNAQILRDLQDSPNGLPLIYAECNFQSRSDRVGHGAGFRIPERFAAGYLVPQILVQNVGVRDGHELEGKLRDFTFMYLPAEVIRDSYSPLLSPITEVINT